MDYRLRTAMSVGAWVMLSLAASQGVAYLLGGCSPMPEPKVAPSGDLSPAGVCAKLTALTCPEAKPAGMGCEESIDRLMHIGTFRLQDAACVASATTRTEVRMCRVKCRQ